MLVGDADHRRSVYTYILTGCTQVLGCDACRRERITEHQTHVFLIKTASRHQDAVIEESIPTTKALLMYF